ncbi:MAG TPA: MAPEG family protein [Steroidobacteraceae bacterium]|nr:MAPEG family protein [Steroidobacteraceae bacterium]
MAPELRTLGWATILGLAYVLTAAAFATQQRGLRWNAGNRDGEVKPLSGAAARAARANHNFLETFPFFAAATLAVVLAQRSSAHTAFAAQLYLWARAAYLPIYLIGIPYVRTLVWAAAFWAVLQMLGALL